MEEWSRLTGGGGLSGIDVADDDHVDVHLLLTAMRREVSRLSIKISAIARSMLLRASQKLTHSQMEGKDGVDSPHDGGCGCLYFGLCRLDTRLNLSRENGCQ